MRERTVEITMMKKGDFWRNEKKNLLLMKSTLMIIEKIKCSQEAGDKIIERSKTCVPNRTVLI